MIRSLSSVANRLLIRRCTSVVRLIRMIRWCRLCSDDWVGVEGDGGGVMLLFVVVLFFVFLISSKSVYFVVNDIYIISMSVTNN